MPENESRELAQPSAGISGALERFDLADDSEIVKAVANRVTESFTYKANGKAGLSASGTFWAVREFAKKGEVMRVIGEAKLERCPIDPEFVIATVKAQRFFVNPLTGDEIALDSAFGSKRMWKKTKIKKYDDAGNMVGEEIVDDPEFTTKALTKAERNAKLKLIPKDVVTQLVDKALSLKGKKPETQKPQGKQNVGQAAPNQQPASKPPDGKQTAPPAQNKAASAAEAPKEAPKQPTAQPAATKPVQQGAPDVVQQRVWAVFKQAAKTDDDNVVRRGLKALCGKENITEISQEVLLAIGPLLHGIVKGVNRFDKQKIVDNVTGEVLWPREAPKPTSAAEPTPAAAPTKEAPPQQQSPAGPEEEPYF